MSRRTASGLYKLASSVAKVIFGRAEGRIELIRQMLRELIPVIVFVESASFSRITPG